jgi:exopolysaccharide biosynthesis polyprenyl glycosylphosphotransferase
VVVFIVATFALKLPGLSRAWTLMAWGFGILFVVIGRAVVRAAVVAARRRGRLLRPTLIAGFNREAADIIRALRANRSSGLVPVGCLASSHSHYPVHDHCGELDVPCLGSVQDIGDVLDRNQIDTVLIASTAYDHDVLARFIDSLRDREVDIQMSSGLLDVTTSRVQIREVSGIPLITLKGVAFSPGKRFAKRTFDLVVGTFFITMGAPLWLLITLAIKLDSRGPVFYRQMRVGRGGRVFDMYKFRSMCDGADARLDELRGRNEATGPLFKMRDDPRVTRVGRLLRKTSLDEFPQLLNVLRGDMSLVGPRPLPTGQTVDMTPMQSRRHEVLPGMTGLWQVSGRSTLTFEEMVRLDLLYIENWSVGFDLALLMRTVPAVLRPEGAY